MHVRVIVPAQSANLGPGYDCLALALGLYNELEVRPTDGPSRLECDPEGYDIGGDLILRAIRVGADDPSLTVTTRSLNRIPPERGLGSSAAAVVAGLVTGRVLAGKPVDRHELLQMATGFEGHPDNAAAALFGGLVAVIDTGGGYRCYRLLCSDGWRLVVCVPEVRVSTQQARTCIPAQVPMATAVHNLGRVALAVSALASGDEDMLTASADDKLHEPFRIPLAVGVEEAIAEAKRAGGRFTVVSGSGSSLLTITRQDASVIKEALARGFSRQGVRCEVRELAPDMHGVRWEVTA